MTHTYSEYQEFAAAMESFEQNGGTVEVVDKGWWIFKSRELRLKAKGSTIDVPLSLSTHRATIKYLLSVKK